jgi:hypothetical protein
MFLTPLMPHSFSQKTHFHKKKFYATDAPLFFSKNPFPQKKILRNQFPKLIFSKNAPSCRIGERSSANQFLKNSTLANRKIWKNFAEIRMSNLALDPHPSPC